MKKFFKAIISFAIIGVMCTNVNAETIEELEQQKEESESKRDEAQALLDQLTDQKNSILDGIAALDKKVADYNTQIEELEAQRVTLQAEIETTQTELEAAKAEEEKQYEDMKLRIQYSYENGNIGYLDTLFTTSDVSDIVNRSEYAEQIYNYDSNMLGNLITIRQNIANAELKLKTDLASVEDIEAEVAADKDAIETMIAGKQVQVENYEASEGVYSDLIAQYQAAVDATEEEIAAAAAAAAEAAENGDTPVYYTGGTFQWPVSSGGTITSPFGYRGDIGVGTAYHNGLDIACPVGTPILAGEAGTVIIAQYSSSAGNYVMIDHGGGVSTVYMHNSSLAVSVGQTVSRGQTIAYSGSTGWSTGPHCHFGLRINGTYVDPLPYLQ